MAAWLRRATLWLGNQKSEGARSNFLQLNDHNQMHMKLAVAIFLVASMSMYAQAQNRSGGKVSKRNSVPNWDVSSSCRAASQFAYNQSAGEERGPVSRAKTGHAKNLLAISRRSLPTREQGV
jgi:hypothetical protein